MQSTHTAKKKAIHLIGVPLMVGVLAASLAAVPADRATAAHPDSSLELAATESDATSQLYVTSQLGTAAQPADPQSEVGLEGADSSESLTTTSARTTSGLLATTAITASTATPLDPTVVFLEDFESEKGLVGKTRSVMSLAANAHTYPQFLSANNNASNGTLTYTADTYWLNHNQCNGVVLSYLSTDGHIWQPQGQNATDQQQACNGVQNALPQTSPGSATAERIFSRNNVRRLAYVLGLVDQGVDKTNGVLAPGYTNISADPIMYPNGYDATGSTGATKYLAALNNSAVTAYSISQYPTSLQSLVFKNAQPVNVTPTATAQSAKRFYTASVDVAELSCGQVANSALEFTLVTRAGQSGQTIHTLTGTSGSRIIACKDSRLGIYTAPTNTTNPASDIQKYPVQTSNPALSGDQWYWGPYAGERVYGGRYYSDAARLIGGIDMQSVNLELRNFTQGALGNDFAFDNIQLVDATPSLYKEFLATDGAVKSPGPVTLMFNVVNTSDLAAKEGWSFTDVLPTGLKVAPTPSQRVEGNCSATFAPIAGATSITVTNGKLNQGAETCKLYVDVVVDASAAPQNPGDTATFTNCPALGPTLGTPAQLPNGYLSHLEGLEETDCADVTFYVDPLLEAEKSVSPDLTQPGSPSGVQPGDTVTYTVKFANTGRNPLPVNYTDSMSDVMDDATFGGSITGVQTDATSTSVAPTVSAAWNAAAHTIVFTGNVPAGHTVTFTYHVQVKTPGVANPNVFGNLTLDNCVRPTGQTVGGDCTHTPVIPPTTVDVIKHEYDETGDPLVPAGWHITASVTGDASGGKPAVSQLWLPQVGGQPVTTQTTGVSGKITWLIKNFDQDARADITLNEDVTSKPGYTTQGFECVVQSAGTGSGTGTGSGSGTGTGSGSGAGSGGTNTTTSTTETITVANVPAGAHVTCELTNTRTPGTVSWQKTDPQGNHLAHSQWTITGPQGPATQTLVVDDCVQDTAEQCATNADKDHRAGYFTVHNLRWGNYTLTETAAPAGYIKLDTITEFTINADSLNVQFTTPFENTLKDPLTLPLTGGSSAVTFTVMGIAASALGAFAALWRRKKNAENTSLTVPIAHEP